MTIKPANVAIGAAIIAMIAGTGGFFLGQRQHPVASPTTPSWSPASTAKQATLPARESKPAHFTDPRPSLDRVQDPLERFNLALRQLESWMHADPNGALDWLNQQQRSARRDEVIRAALDQYAENDPQGAAQWAQNNLTGISLNNALIRIAEEWAQQDGGKAANWFLALPPTPERDAAVEGLMFTWASGDPAAASAFLSRLASDDPLSTVARQATFAGWAKSDPERAVAASLESSRTHHNPAQFANTLANWGVVDLNASSRWLLSNVTDSTERAPAVRELATLFAHQSPDAGLAWIEKLNAGTERSEALNTLASEWATTDAPAAAAWMSRQPQGTLTDQTSREVIQNYLAADSAAFETWRASLPEGPLKSLASSVGAATEDED